MTVQPVIREARLPEDAPAFSRFIDLLQAFERAFEPNRRVDPLAGADYLAVLLERAEKSQGRIFVAEVDGAPVGWAVFLVSTHENYVIEQERQYGLVSELFVEQQARGKGVGRALISACEGASRELKLPSLMIGVLAGNANARKSYAAAGFAPYTMQLRKYL